MPSPSNIALKLALAAVCAGFAAAVPAAASQVVPADPAQFEALHLRITVDSCTFDANSLQVELRGDRIAATYRPRRCLIPGPAQVVDIALGAYPPGEYQAELFEAGSREPILRVPFRVSGIVTTPVEPRPALPSANYRGLWGAAQEPGWGLTLEQGATGQLFGALYVFDGARQPQWYTLQGGSWTSPTRWTGQVVKSEGPAWTSPTYPPDSTQYRGVGTATLDFLMTPGSEGQASFSYTINGQTVDKTISRYRLR